MVVSLCSVALLCPTLCDPMDYSSPGSSLHGILQARILETAIPLSRGSSWPRDQTHVSCDACISRQVLSHCACGSLLVRYFISNCTDWWINQNAFKRRPRLPSFLLGERRSRTTKQMLPGARIPNSLSQRRLPGRQKLEQKGWCYRQCPWGRKSRSSILQRERNRLGNFQSKKLAYRGDTDKKPGQRLSPSMESTCRSACAPRPSPWTWTTRMWESRQGVLRTPLPQALLTNILISSSNTRDTFLLLKKRHLCTISWSLCFALPIARSLFLYFLQANFLSSTCHFPCLPARRCCLHCCVFSGFPIQTKLIVYSSPPSPPPYFAMLLFLLSPRIPSFFPFH